MCPGARLSACSGGGREVRGAAQGGGAPGSRLRAAWHVSSGRVTTRLQRSCEGTRPSSLPGSHLLFQGHQSCWVRAHPEGLVIT